MAAHFESESAQIEFDIEFGFESRFKVEELTLSLRELNSIVAKVI